MDKLGKSKMLERALKLDVVIGDSVEKMSSLLPKYERIACSVSGGKDSDIMLDLCWNLDMDNKVRYIWFDTGIEHKATKEHLNFLEEKYGIRIERIKAIKSIPKSVKEYGQPFLSKTTSECIERLQQHGFQWEDEPFDVLYEKYPHLKSALKWWCDIYGDHKGRQASKFSVASFKYLKSFLIENPPTFQISANCCKYAKKEVAKHFNKTENIELMMTGVRRAEGGVRAFAYTNCFTSYSEKTDQYRPLFWYKNESEREYIDAFGVENSACYTEWGFKRTGCVGCPFNPRLSKEMEIIRQYEPGMAKACEHVFADSYAYTKQYRNYVTQMKERK